MTGVVNSLGKGGCWNWVDPARWKESCPLLTKEQKAELAAPGGPSLLNMVDLEDDAYAAKMSMTAYLLPL